MLKYNNQWFQAYKKSINKIYDILIKIIDSGS